MKDITDSFKEEIEWNIDLEKKSGNTIIQKVNIEILKNLKYFKVDSIHDLKYHYDKLSELSLIELSLKNDDDKNKLSAHMENVIYNDKHFNLIGCYSDDLDSWQIKINLKLVEMDGVYFENLKHIEEKSFGAFELNIKDYHNEIEGIFVYSNNMKTLEEDDTPEKQINKVSSSLNYFDIKFKLFSKNTEISNIGYTHLSGEKLYIIDILDDDRRNKEEDHTPTGSNVSSSPLVLV